MYTIVISIIIVIAKFIKIVSQHFNTCQYEKFKMHLYLSPLFFDMPKQPIG